MRSVFKRLIVLLLLSSVAAVQAQDARKEHPAAPFSITSLESAFSFAGGFEGKYRVSPAAIEITLSTAKIYLRDNAPYRGRRELAFINVGLAAFDSTGKQTIISRGRAIPVGKIMRPGDAYLSEELRFSIPVAGDVDISQCWLVVEMGTIALDYREKDRVSYAFAQSDRRIFASNLSEASKK